MQNFRRRRKVGNNFTNLKKIECSLPKILDLTPSLKWRPGAVFGCNSSEYEGFYRAAVVEKEGTSKARVQFIDFGNYEIKPLSDLLNIPKDLAKEVSFAVGVTLQNSLEDTEDNRNSIEEKLGSDNLTVTVVDGSAEFAVDGGKIDFKGSNPPKLKSVKEPVQDIPKVSECKIAEENTRSDPKNQLLPETQVSTDMTAIEEEEVKVKMNDHEESIKPIKLQEASLENERDVRKAGKIFSDAIANLKSQDHKTGPSKPFIPSSTAPSSSSIDCPWKKGDAVVVRSVTGIWQKASVLEVRPDKLPNSVLVSSPGAPPMWKRTKDIRSSCVPMDALNLIEKDLNSNLVRPQGDGEVAEETKPCLPLRNVVGKVRDWMDKNIDIAPASSKVSPTKLDSTKSIPQGPKLVTYIQNSAGSNHVQAVLSTSNLNLARYAQLHRRILYH